MASDQETEIVEMPMPLGILAGHLFQRAVEYTDTLKILAEHDRAPLRPAGFVFAHALEVGLKSFLAAEGVTKREMQRVLGHNLQAIMDRAEELGLPPVDNLRAFANHMHEMNRDFDLRYPSEWHIQIPKAKDCVPIAEGMLYAIRDQVEGVRLRANIRFAADTRHLRGKRIVFNEKAPPLSPPERSIDETTAPGVPTTAA